MSHSGTRQLISAWAALPGSGSVPQREALDPQSIADLLPQVFMAQKTDAGVRFRMAGAWIERLHGGSMRGRHWLDLWRREARLTAHRAAASALKDGRPLVLTAEAGEAGERVEIVLAPMRGPSGAADRLLGLYQPMTLDAVALKGIGEMGLVSVEPAALPGDRPALNLAAFDGRRIA